MSAFDLLVSENRVELTNRASTATVARRASDLLARTDVLVVLVDEMVRDLDGGVRRLLMIPSITVRFVGKTPDEEVRATLRKGLVEIGFVSVRGV